VICDQVSHEQICDLFFTLGIHPTHVHAHTHKHTYTHTHTHNQQEVLYFLCFFFGVSVSAFLTPVAMLINHLTLVPLTFVIFDLYLCLTFSYYTYPV